MAKRKINIEDVGLDKRYYPVIDTHNSFCEGGHKVHIKDYDTGKCLCGYEPWLASAIDYEEVWGNIVNYLSQPDPDTNICQRCKQMMINALEIKED